MGPTFSEHSYGFRPGRSAHQAVAQAQLTLPRATVLWLTLISKNFSTGSIMTA
jgi:retron-type reverse transcriptase